MRNALTNTALIGMSGFLLYLWIELWIGGDFCMGEPNIGIRIWETMMWAGLIVLGLYNLIRMNCK